VGLDVTSKRLADEAAFEALAKYQQLIESISDWVWEADAEGRYTYSSPKVSDMLGYRLGEIIGRRFDQIMPPVESRRVKSAIAAAAREQQQFARLETHYLHRSGDLVLLETSLMIVYDRAGCVSGLRGVDRDITERRRDEQRLRQLFQAVEQSPDSVIITDPSGRIEYVNPKFCEITGYPADEVRGKNPRFLKSGAIPPALYHDLWRRIGSGLQWHGEFCNKETQWRDILGGGEHLSHQRTDRRN
jgi:PAS domain S-box-containing protein